MNTDQSVLAIQQAKYREVRNRIWNAPKKSTVPLISPFKSDAAGIQPKTIEFQLSFSICVAKPAVPRAATGDGARKTFNQICVEVLIDFPGVTIDEIRGGRRLRRLVKPRHQAMYQVYKQRPDATLTMIGRYFGGRDHTTIIHAVRKMERQG